jgi:hypothetical protein
MLACCALFAARAQGEERRIRLAWPVELPCREPRGITVESVDDALKARWVPESETDLQSGYLELITTSSLAQTRTKVTVAVVCEHSNQAVSWSCDFNGCRVMATYGPARWLLASDANLQPPGIKKLADGRRSTPGEGVVDTALIYLKLSKSLIERACPNNRCSREASYCKKELASLLQLDRKNWSLGQVRAKPVRTFPGSYELPGGIAELKVGEGTRAHLACNHMSEPAEVGCMFSLSAPGCRWTYSIDTRHRLEAGQLGKDGSIWESQNLSISGGALRVLPIGR